MYKLSLMVLLAVVAASQGYNEKLVGLLSSPNSPSNNSPLGIHSGQRTTIQKHPYLVAVLLNRKLLGAATIVSNRWVVFGAELKGMLGIISLVAASSDGSTGKKYSLKKLVVHPKYNGTADYDYALGQIKGKFKWSKKTKPIKLATKQPKANTPMVVASFGATSETVEGDSSNSALMQGTMKWLSHKACVAAYKNENHTITARMGCAYNKGKTTLCNGDWSAPFVSDNLLYGYFIATDMKLWCTPKALPDVVAIVPNVASWIKKITGAKTEDDEV